MLKKMHGIESAGASNGAEAVDQVKVQLNLGCCPMRAIFMDVQMPIMNGIESTTQIRKLYQEKAEREGK